MFLLIADILEFILGFVDKNTPNSLKQINMQKYQKIRDLDTLELLTKNQNPDFLDTLSIVYAANNNYQSAKQASLKAIELWKKNSLCFASLGLLFSVDILFFDLLHSIGCKSRNFSCGPRVN